MRILPASVDEDGPEAQSLAHHFTGRGVHARTDFSSDHFFELRSQIDVLPMALLLEDERSLSAVVKD